MQILQTCLHGFQINKIKITDLRSVLLVNSQIKFNYDVQKTLNAFSGLTSGNSKCPPSLLNPFSEYVYWTLSHMLTTRPGLAPDGMS